jgi:hypothetical protein
MTIPVEDECVPFGQRTGGDHCAYCGIKREFKEWPDGHFACSEDCLEKLQHKYCRYCGDDEHKESPMKVPRYCDMDCEIRHGYELYCGGTVANTKIETYYRMFVRQTITDKRRHKLLAMLRKFTVDPKKNDIP